MSYIIESKHITSLIYRSKLDGRIVTSSVYVYNPDDYYITSILGDSVLTYTESTTINGVPSGHHKFRAFTLEEYIAYRDERILQESKNLLRDFEELTRTSICFYLKNTTLYTSESQLDRLRALNNVSIKYLEDGTGVDILTTPADELDMDIPSYASLVIEEYEELINTNDNLLAVINICKDLSLKEINKGIFRNTPNLKDIIEANIDDNALIISTYNAALMATTPKLELPVFSNEE